MQGEEHENGAAMQFYVPFSVNVDLHGHFAFSMSMILLVEFLQEVQLVETAKQVKHLVSHGKQVEEFDPLSK